MSTFLYVANGTNAANANGVGDSADQQLLFNQEGKLRDREKEAEQIVNLERYSTCVNIPTFFVSESCLYSTTSCRA